MKVPFLSLTLLVLELAGRVSATKLSSANENLHTSIPAGQECYRGKHLATSATSSDASNMHCGPSSALDEVGANKGHQDVMNILEDPAKNPDGQGSTNHAAKELNKGKKLPSIATQAFLLRRKLTFVRCIPVKNKTFEQREMKKNGFNSVKWTLRDIDTLQQLRKVGFPGVERIENYIDLAKRAVPDFDGKPNDRKVFTLGATAGNVVGDSTSHSMTEEEQKQLADQIFKERIAIAARPNDCNPFGLSSAEMVALGELGQELLTQLYHSERKETRKQQSAKSVRKILGPPLATGMGTPEQQQRRRDHSMRTIQLRLKREMLQRAGVPLTHKGRGRPPRRSEEDTTRLDSNLNGGGVESLETNADRTNHRSSILDQEAQEPAARVFIKTRKHVEGETSTSKKPRTTHSSTPAQIATDALPLHAQPSSPPPLHLTPFHDLHTHPLPTDSPPARPSFSLLFDPFAPLIHDREYEPKLDGLKFLLSMPEHAPPSAPPEQAPPTNPPLSKLDKKLPKDDS